MKKMKNISLSVMALIYLALNFLTPNASATIYPATPWAGTNLMAATSAAQALSQLGLTGGGGSSLNATDPSAEALLSQLVTVTTVQITNTLSGAGQSDVNGIFWSTPGAYPPYTATNGSGDILWVTNVSPYYQVWASDYSVEYYTSVNGTNWTSTFSSYNPAPSGTIALCTITNINVQLSNSVVTAICTILNSLGTAANSSSNAFYNVGLSGYLDQLYNLTGVSGTGILMASNNSVYIRYPYIDTMWSAGNASQPSASYAYINTNVVTVAGAGTSVANGVYFFYPSMGVWSNLVTTAIMTNSGAYLIVQLGGTKYYRSSNALLLPQISALWQAGGGYSGSTPMPFAYFQRIVDYSINNVLPTNIPVSSIVAPYTPGGAIVALATTVTVNTNGIQFDTNAIQAYSSNSAAASLVSYSNTVNSLVTSVSNSAVSSSSVILVGSLTSFSNTVNTYINGASNAAINVSGAASAGLINSFSNYNNSLVNSVSNAAIASSSVNLGSYSNTVTGLFNTYSNVVNVQMVAASNSVLNVGASNAVFLANSVSNNAIAAIMAASNNVVVYVSTNNTSITQLGSNLVNNITVAGPASVVLTTNANGSINAAFTSNAQTNAVLTSLSTGNGGGLTNLAYANLVGAPAIPSTNGFVTGAVTNGLATTNIVNSAILTLQSNLTVPASKTNSGLATITNVFAAAQNIGAPLTMANGGLPKLGFDSWPSSGSAVSFSSVTNFMMQWTNCGMNLHGWKTCIIDDGWCMGHTNIGGNWYPLVNASRFPSASEPGGGGFSPLVNFLTNSGLAFGLYTENGTNTSAHYVGSFGYEISDVTYYATNWGCKWLRFDGQPDTYEDSLVSYALKQLNSDIWLQSGTPTSPWPYPIYVFSGMVHSVKTNPYGDSISWPQCVSNILAQLQYGWQQRPGFLTEDMNTDFMQYTNQYQELALWGIEAMLSQSMQLGWVTEADTIVGYYKPYINSDLLAIDQDTKCIPATVALVTNGCMVFVKPLGQAGPLQDYEVGIWNTNTFNLTNFTFSLASVGIPYSVVTVRDSWIQATEIYATNNVTVTPWNVQQDHYTGHELTNLVSQSLSLLRISPGVRTPFAIGTNNLTVINWLDATNNQGSYGNMVGCNRDYFGYLRPFATNYSHTVTGVAVTNNFIEFQDWGSVTYFIGSQPTNFTCEVALTDGSSISGGESFWVYTNGVLAASNSVANPSGGTGTTNFFNLALAGVNTLTITATHTNGPGNASAMIINPQVVCGYETIPNAGEPGYVSYNYSVSGSALPAQNLTGTLPTLYLTNSGNTGFVVTNVTASGVGLGTSYVFGTNGLLKSSSLGVGSTFCSSYYDSSGATAISVTSSAGGYVKITGCSGLMASNLVAINTITATNGHISSPITGNTSDLFAGYSTNGTKIFQVDSNGVVNGNGSGLTNLQPSNLTGNQGRVVTTSGPNIPLATGVTYFPLGYWNASASVGAGQIAGFVGSCSNFCFSETTLGTTNVSVYIGINSAINSETYLGTIFPTVPGYYYTNWATTFYNNNLTNQIFLVLSNWSATTTVSSRFQLTFTY